MLREHESREGSPMSGHPQLYHMACTVQLLLICIGTSDQVGRVVAWQWTVIRRSGKCDFTLYDETFSRIYPASTSTYRVERGIF